MDYAFYLLVLITGMSGQEPLDYRDPSDKAMSSLEMIETRVLSLEIPGSQNGGTVPYEATCIAPTWTFYRVDTSS